MSAVTDTVPRPESRSASHGTRTAGYLPAVSRPARRGSLRTRPERVARRALPPSAGSSDTRGVARD